jgi:hypothetical protein
VVSGFGIEFDATKFSFGAMFSNFSAIAVFRNFAILVQFFLFDELVLKV